MDNDLPTVQVEDQNHAGHPRVVPGQGEAGFSGVEKEKDEVDDSEEDEDEDNGRHGDVGGMQNYIFDGNKKGKWLVDATNKGNVWLTQPAAPAATRRESAPAALPSRVAGKCLASRAASSAANSS